MQATNGFLAKSDGKDKLTALVQARTPQVLGWELQLPRILSSWCIHWSTLLHQQTQVVYQSLPVCTPRHIRCSSPRACQSSNGSHRWRKADPTVCPAVCMHVHQRRRARECEEDSGICGYSKEGLPYHAGSPSRLSCLLAEKLGLTTRLSVTVS